MQRRPMYPGVVESLEEYIRSFLTILSGNVFPAMTWALIHPLLGLMLVTPASGNSTRSQDGDLAG